MAQSEGTTFAPRDAYERALAEELEKLRACQKEHKRTSCMTCSEVIGCEVRKSYVQAVYLSMNKGKGGGFEF